MRIAALHHTGMAVSSAMEFTLGRSNDEIFWVEVVDELVAEFGMIEERHSRLE
jgi:hypothetical protein